MALKAKICRVKKRKRWIWQVDLRKFGGGRTSHSTEEKAKAFAEHKLSEVKDYGESALKLTQEQRIRFLHAIDRLQKFNATLEDCLDFYERHNVALTTKTISDIGEEFARVKRQSGKRHRYVLMLESAVRMLEAGTGAKYPNDVKTESLEQWFNKKNYAGSSRKSLMTHLATFFDFALKRGYAADNPVKRMERVSLDDKPPGILTVDRCEHLLETCQRVDPALLDFIAVQLFGGLRPVEAQALSAADFKDGHINVTSTGSKTRRRRLVTIGDTLRTWLSDPPNLPAVNWRRRLGAVKAAAGMTEAWPSDCLRHTAASMMLPISGAAETAMQLGHSERVLFKHYREIVTKKEAEAFYSLTKARKKP